MNNNNNRFKISFNNSGNGNVPGYNNLASTVSPHVSSLPKPSITRSGGLNAPMVERVYKARPGCSACGKKVA